MTSDETLLKKAELGANWLFEKAIDKDYGGYRCRYESGKFKEWLCSFDNGMILNGLMNLYNLTKKRKYLLKAIELGDWLLTFKTKKDGTFDPKYDTKRKKYVDTQERWSTQTGAFLVKNSIGLINLAEKTGEEKYIDTVRKMCDFSLTRQEENGRFVTNKRLNDTYMHPHCYAIEGLLVAGYYLDEKKYILACKKAADWTKKALLKGGRISKDFNSKAFLNDTATDSTSQSLRIWILLSHYGDFELPEETSLKIIDFLISMQCKSDDPRANGGFYYAIINNKIILHVSTHATMFTLQTLDLYERRSAGEFEFAITHLI